MFFFTILLCFQSNSAEIPKINNDIATIQLLLQQQNYQQAFKLAEAKKNEYEGDEQFDYIYALSAQANQQHDKAIFALERIIQQKPYSFSVRFALASSYFAIGNDKAAEVEFLIVQQHAKAGDFPNLSRYLTAIEQHKKATKAHWIHHLGLGLGIDSNANSGVTSDSVNIPFFGDIPLFDSSKKISDTLLQTYWQSQYVKPINLNTAWFSLIKINYANYQQYSDMSRLYADLFLGWQSKIKQFNVNFTGFYRPLWLSNERYVNYQGITTDISRKTAQNQRIGLSVLAADLSFEQNNIAKRQVSISPWIEWTQKINRKHKLLLNWGDESPYSSKLNYISRQFWGFGYQFNQIINQNHSLSLKFDYNKAVYQQQHPLFLQIRNDKLFKLSAVYQYNYSSKFQWFIEAMALKNQSNLPLYDYKRTLLTSSIQYQF
jgi:hypothetical protein